VPVCWSSELSAEGTSASEAVYLWTHRIAEGGDMARLRARDLPATLHLGAATVLVIVLTQGTERWSTSEGFDPMLESGKWALRLLLGCLAITPLVTYLGWSEAGRLRKPLLSLREDLALTRWQPPVAPFLLLGALALLILTALALTSHRRAMRWLGRRWKRLHRLVYLAGGATVAHALLAALTSKKMFVRDPQAVYELQLAAMLLTVLLVVRIPVVRQMLQPALATLRQRLVRPQRQATPIAPPEIAPSLPDPERTRIVPSTDTWQPPAYEPDAEEAEETLVAS
jgi:methionine sulfoxide reductase heme-binding subunit